MVSLAGHIVRLDTQDSALISCADAHSGRLKKRGPFALASVSRKRDVFCCGGRDERKSELVRVFDETAQLVYWLS